MIVHEIMIIFPGLLCCLLVFPNDSFGLGCNHMPAMSSTLIAMTSNLIAMASNLTAMASNLRAMAFLSRIASLKVGDLTEHLSSVLLLETAQAQVGASCFQELVRKVDRLQAIQFFLNLG